MKITHCAIFAVLVATACAAADIEDRNMLKAEIAAPNYPSDYKDPCYSSPLCFSAAVGSGEISSARLLPYSARWSSWTLLEGEWQDTGGIFEEVLTRRPDGMLEHVQVQLIGDGSSIIGTRILDGQTLAVVEQRMEFDQVPGAPMELYYDLSGKSYVANVILEDGTKQTGVDNPLPIPMYDAQIFGLAIAALPLEIEYTATLPAVMPHMAARYWVEISVTGRELVQLNDGQEQDAWIVETGWLDLDTGSLSKAGAKEPGGAYLVAINPSSGIPAIIEYANNGAKVIWEGKLVN